MPGPPSAEHARIAGSAGDLELDRRSRSTATRGWPSAGEPPGELDEYETGGSMEEVLSSFHGDVWLFPPDETLGNAVASRSFQAPTKGPCLGASEHGIATPTFPVRRIDFLFIHLQSRDAQDLVRVLLDFTASPGETRPRAFGRAFDRFAREEYALRISGRLFEAERHYLESEAFRALEEMVRAGVLSVASDLVFCLESFGITRSRPSGEQQHVTRLIGQALERALGAAPEHERERWRAQAVGQLAEAEIYSRVDVRAWPEIIRCVSSTDLNWDYVQTQLRLQLCIGSGRQAREAGLMEAAELLSMLPRAANFEAHELYSMFNDRENFGRRFREQVLARALRRCPRETLGDVLRRIDEGVDHGERHDEELVLVNNLVVSLNADIRSCPNAFYKMKEEWLCTYSTGVVQNEELSPEQVCDHIEDDLEGNHEELLAVAVRRYLKHERKFCAAKILSRPKSATTKVFDNNRNDRQLVYLMSLYREVEATEDDFSPIEDGAMKLPCRTEDVLYVEAAGPALTRLERETLGEVSSDDGEMQTPALVLGVWWFWRCFNPRLDLWSRASFVVMAYNETFAIVDFQRLELHYEQDDEDYRRVLRVVSRILASPRILKVTHELDRWTLETLQRALVPANEGEEEEESTVVLSPFLDMSVVLAFLHRTKPIDSQKTHLAYNTWDYFGVELCSNEALGNFERRPLRQTQMHYALSIAFVPLVLLRSACSFGLLSAEQVFAMCLQVGAGNQAPTRRWDEDLRRISFARGPTPDDEGAAEIQGKPGCFGDLWQDEEWVKARPKPDPLIDQRLLYQLMAEHASALALPELAWDAVRTLFDRPTVELLHSSMHAAYITVQAARVEAGIAGFL
eukprot:TRINITY_DN28072_c0_g1_i2.p1 TRINITY_DN28072_c0_g1~~TRINITY_DN28072_c0_g1_i2.p1  ORF type:complete len:857 (+),score=118.87 TRINITY_DN28072_c0_g1_i2:147-2717(+)